MSARVLPNSVNISKHSTHPALTQVPASLSGHVISVYADNTVFDETTNLPVLPETLTRLGK